MKIKTIRKNHKKQIIVGIVAFIVITIVLMVGQSFAKYNLVKSIKIVEGTINYKQPDFKIIAMYKNDGKGDIEIDTMPESGYTINESKSYCTLDNINKDPKAKLYTDDKGQHVILGLSKSSKCYLYFDDYKKVNTALGEITVKLATPDFRNTSCEKGCEESTVGIYQAKDNDGWSYYYRGDVENNYVRFANKWWRIIRINGDGSIRLIYDGTSGHANGTDTTDSIALSNVKFSTSDGKYNNNMYVGLKYTNGQVHGLGTKSNALTQLETWYKNNLSSYASKLDTNSGFCGDRTSSTSKTDINNLGGTGSTESYYGGYIRLNTNKVPDLTCANASDLYTVSSSNKGNKSLAYPIGLISADEVSMAGGRQSLDNNNYYLRNGQYYWTMSPYAYTGNTGGLYAHIYGITSNGRIHMWSVNSAFDIRPVINLRSDVTFTFTGTESLTS